MVDIFIDNQTEFLYMLKTKKAKNRTNCAVLGENGTQGVPAGPKRLIIAVE